MALFSFLRDYFSPLYIDMARFFFFSDIYMRFSENWQIKIWEKVPLHDYTRHNKLIYKTMMNVPVSQAALGSINIIKEYFNL